MGLMQFHLRKQRSWWTYLAPQRLQVIHFRVAATVCSVARAYGRQVEAVWLQTCGHLLKRNFMEIDIVRELQVWPAVGDNDEVNPVVCSE